jgi:hypothetical protein
MGEDSTGGQSGRRVTVDEAARHLGLSVDAVRKRVQREQIPHERDQAGRVRIILDESETLQDAVQTSARDELLDELRDQVRFLREELARKDAILLRMAENIPQIEAPASPEPREPPTEAAADTESTEPLSSTPGPQDRISRPWWRRMFGG